MSELSSKTENRCYKTLQRVVEIINFGRTSKEELEDSPYIPLYLHVNHIATAMYLIQVPHQVTIFTTIEPSAVFNIRRAT